MSALFKVLGRKRSGNKAAEGQQITAEIDGWAAADRDDLSEDLNLRSAALIGCARDRSSVVFVGFSPAAATDIH